MASDDTAAAQLRFWEQVAARYDPAMALAERFLIERWRRRLLSRASGRTLEVGIGTGVNLRHYPSGVELVGVDSSPAMLARAVDRAADLDRGLRAEVGFADRLPFGAAEFDTVVATLLLCSVPDVAKSLVEFARVLRPQGQLLLLDHVESSAGVIRGGQWAADRLTAGIGEQWRRRPLGQLSAAEFAVEEVKSGPGRLLELVVARRRGPD